MVCKEAFCCEKYMEQIMTKEYEGIPEIKRTEPTLNKGERLWKEFKDNNTEK